MNCKKVINALSSYMDGELGNAEIRELESHLERCDSCARELESLRASAVFVGDKIRDLELRPELWRNIKAQVSALPAPEESRGFLDLLIGRPQRAFAAAAALVFILGVGVWGLFRYHEAERAFAQYMSDYIRDRDLQQEAEKAAKNDDEMALDSSDSDYSYGDMSDNPFVVTSFSPDENPFRSEEQ